MHGFGLLEREREIFGFYGGLGVNNVLQHHEGQLFWCLIFCSLLLAKFLFRFVDASALVEDHVTVLVRVQVRLRLLERAHYEFGTPMALNF